MKRHTFEPGKLVAALVVLAAALLYGMDAAGQWDIPVLVLFPLICGGLFLAGAVSAVTYDIRRRRARGGEPARSGGGAGIPG
ncbi:hypothetical protein IHE55_17415 [Streptomyces pactum]|uniref:Uncharacterized protein n=1 Tax=Streptomyces pactum TaxID=68249 RepID=A0ABS0NMN4_9ACTN|nr:hypothetical protein [Streptomyces pactum]MBH5336459.1 hypothetical protein [Streptomyces pactum]